MGLVHYRVVVVGAGPAGTSAAMTLASHHIDVCLIDKSLFPREKLCGGLLTLRSRRRYEQIFGDGWEDLVVTEAHGVRFFDRNNFLSEVKDYSTLYFTQRSLFDHALLKKATASGAEALLGSAVEDIDFAKRELSLKNGDRIGYDYLIGADGVRSLVAKRLYGRSYDPEKIGFALECEVPLSEDVARVERPEIYFNLIEWGYGWVFPKKESLTVGIGGLYSRNKDMREKFDHFLRQRFGILPPCRVKGYHIPFGAYRKRVSHGNVLLCGDAAGLVETITGEGIAFAMESGYDAARCIVAKLEDPMLNIESTCARSRRKIISILRISNLLRYLLFTRPANRLFVRALSRSKSIGKRHLDLMADEIGYAQYLKIIMKKIVSKPFTFLRFKS